MARKSWSHVFFLAAVFNAGVALMPRNPVKTIDWLMVPTCLLCGVLIRRPMITKVQDDWRSRVSNIL